MSGVGSIPQSAATAQQPDASFTLGDLIALIEQRAALILKVALAVMVATAIVLLMLPTLYTTQAIVTIDTRKNNIADQTAVLSALPTDPASLQNQLQILYSRDLASEVIGQLRLYDDPEFNAALNPGILAAFNPRNWSERDLARERDDVITAFLNRLSVDPLGLSTSIAVTFTARDPDKAARIANAVVDAYVADQLGTKREATDRTAAWLRQRIRTLGAQAQAAADAVQLFKSENGLGEAADGTPLIEEQVATLNAQIAQARAELAQKEATYSHVSAFGNGGETAQLPQVMSSPLIVELRAQEAQVIRDEAQLAQRYGPRHPKMIAMEDQRRDLDTKINAEVNRIAGSLGSDVSVVRSQIGALQASLAAAERVAAGESPAWARLKALEANAAAARASYESLVTRLEQTEGQDELQTADARVISHAPIPNAPSAPHRTLIFAASIPAGLLLGLLCALLAERFAPRRRVPVWAPAYAQAPLRTPQPGAMAPPAYVPAAVHAPSPQPQLAPVPPQPAAAYAAQQQPASQPQAQVRMPSVLAEIPNASDSRAVDYVIDWPRSAFATNVTALVGRIFSSKGARVIEVTAADPKDGKTAIAVAFARAAALAGKKAVIVDGDLARPITAVAMGLAPTQVGIVEVLTGQAPLSRALLMDPRSNAFVLSCAKPVRDPVPVWTAPQFAQLIAHLKTTCDLIVIDAPPAQSEAARLIAHSADAVVMAVARTKAHQPGIANAVYQMAAQPTPVGIVLVG
jgi:uncharacterized protein involved in exopolysaccharide biosynthesis/Mrp family chromosome partitioning ATPase